jgi:multidrug transporter EmrE-like cation transporter
MQQWLYLFGAIVCEVIATTNLKLSQGFTKPLPSIIVIVGYVLSFWVISIAMKTMPLNIAYPVWAGLGTVLVVAAGIVFFHEALTPLRISAILLVIVGVVMLNLSGVHRFE